MVLVGIKGLDTLVPVRGPDGKVIGFSSLRTVLYLQFFLSDKVRLFWEIHQEGPGADVDIVRPDTDEAEHYMK